MPLFSCSSTNNHIHHSVVTIAHGCLQAILSFQAKTVKRGSRVLCLHKYDSPIHGFPSQKVIKRLMLSKAVPDGLKFQEIEQGSRCNKLPIPYIPEKTNIISQFSSSLSQVRWSCKCPFGHDVLLSR